MTLLHRAIKDLVELQQAKELIHKEQQKPKAQNLNRDVGANQKMVQPTFYLPKFTLKTLSVSSTPLTLLKVRGFQF